MRACSYRNSELHGVRAACRERFDSGAVAQPVRAELAHDRQIRGRPGRFANNVCRTREWPIEALRERLEVRHGYVVGELRFSRVPERERARDAGFQIGAFEDEFLDVRQVLPNDPAAGPNRSPFRQSSISSRSRCPYVQYAVGPAFER